MASCSRSPPEITRRLPKPVPEVSVRSLDANLGSGQGTILFLPAGRFSSLGSASLRRVESSARRPGCDRRAVAMVQRRRTRRHRLTEPHVGYGNVAPALDACRVETISCRRAVAAGSRRPTAMHSHRSSLTNRRFRRRPRTSTLRRLAPQKGGRPKPPSPDPRQQGPHLRRLTSHQPVNVPPGNCVGVAD
jgi:hypothetical protein